MKREYILPGVILLLVAIAAFIVYLHGTNIPVLEPAGPVALAERHVIFVTLALCSIVVVPVFVLLFYFAWKYRDESPQAPVHHDPDWDHDSFGAELIWWLVPTIIIFILAGIAWQSSHVLDPYQPLQGSGQTIEVEVVALDWKWLFIYPQFDIASVNMLEFPENAPVHFDLTADAPMNSFWIPQLGGQIMVMPGMQTQLNLLASRTGIFNGSSANISGAGFSGMTFTVNSVSQSDFENWINAIRISQNPLTLDTYSVLAAPSEDNPVAYYSPVDENLYTSVINKFMMPKSEMQSAMMDTSVNALNADQTIATSTKSPMIPAMNMQMSTTTP
jgi:cytochrome o ubiquinol oxidase subunit 2